MRIGLGCMRVTREETIEAALDAGITLFDTARAYEGSEALLGRTLKGRDIRIVTKGGMARPDGRWEPDGRAKSISADCEASLEALGGLAIDTYLLHAPDPRHPFSTSVRALAALLERGLVKKIGVSNVTRSQLDAACAIAPISAVEVELGWLSDSALRSGVVARCAELGIEILAHRPLGGEKRARNLRKDPALAAVGEKHGATAAEIALALLLDLHPAIVALPGATRPETVRSCARAADIVLDAEDRAKLTRIDRRLASAPKQPERYADGEVVLLMGIQGCGKTDAAEAWIARGYERMNRDERGGTMRGLHAFLDARLSAGARRVVLDNTYVTRESRRDAIEVAWRHSLPVRGIWIDAPLALAQVNVALRMLRVHGRLLEPDELTGKTPDTLAPTGQLRLLRALERPSEDEGFAVLDVLPYTRRAGEGRAGRFVALDAWRGEPADLVFAWRKERPASLPAEIAFASCPHPAGPPVCWCRPPLPGLVLAHAAKHGIDPAKSVIAGNDAMAAALGAHSK